MSERFDPECVRQLAQILSETGLTEIEVEGKDGGRIRVVREHPPVAAATMYSAAAPALAPVVAPSVAAPAPAAAQTNDDAHHPGAVMSPMVGVAYLSPDPGTEPFVQVGQTVTAGQTVMLIEAMKTFNQIKATKAGTVRRILVTSGAPVEYGQPLMIIE
jgi:acetyl-CoA carboxylase biotin carboxyl carrier protein